MRVRSMKSKGAKRPSSPAGLAWRGSKGLARLVYIIKTGRLVCLSGQGSEATENAIAKHEARGSEVTENVSAQHEARGSEATEQPHRPSLKRHEGPCKASPIYLNRTVTTVSPDLFVYPSFKIFLWAKRKRHMIEASKMWVRSPGERSDWECECEERSLRDWSDRVAPQD